MRGAWIEIYAEINSASGLGRSPCGERGLKFIENRLFSKMRGRSPCGERGLKSYRLLWKHWEQFVAPHAGSVD